MATPWRAGVGAGHNRDQSWLPCRHQKNKQKAQEVSVLLKDNLELQHFLQNCQEVRPVGGTALQDLRQSQVLGAPALSQEQWDFIGGVLSHLGYPQNLRFCDSFVPLKAEKSSFDFLSQGQNVSEKVRSLSLLQSARAWPGLASRACDLRVLPHRYLPRA